MVGWGCIDSQRVAEIRFLLVVNIFKIAIPLAAMICFSAVAPLTVAADSSAKKRSSSTSSKKKSSKKSAKSSKSAQSRKGKTKSTTAKKKGKSERRTAKSEASATWIDELPEVELPTISGPAEEELLETVDMVEVETESDADADPEP